MRIGIDVDGVLSLFMEEFVSYLATVPGMEHCTIETAEPSWSFYKGWKMNTPDFLTHFHAGVDAGHIFSKAEPLPGAVEATHKLHEAGHSVHIVTDCNMGLSRAGVSQRARAMWLAKHGFYFDSITFTADKTSVPTDVFVDDKVENCLDLWNAGTQCYLLDRPWNQMNNPAWPDWYPDGFDPAWRVSSVLEFATEICTGMKEKVNG